jgi:hypothetical protein
MKTIILLTISNVFMTFAWYGHLRFTTKPLWIVIFVSWLIAFFEYCFQVPANRIGHVEGFSAAQITSSDSCCSCSRGSSCFTSGAEPERRNQPLVVVGRVLGRVVGRVDGRTNGRVVGMAGSRDA